ncbi:unnamed protein product [Blumeria hordei]|uniref:Mediator of RNA polymerase II transcription subunit 19 n=1 Tax=Blumeria hordei TaxID=2867405 RepID=A0A383V302_BLUHO|nr:unnamed protein product [Blumeria hordei]
MHFDHPQTPGSSHSYHTESSKKISSPTAHSLPTPAHSIDGSVSSTCTEMYPDGNSNKRKRESDDTEERELKKVDFGYGRLRLEDLHLDTGKKYKLCHTPHSPAIPDLKEDLFEMYGLEAIAKSVARTNPDGSKGVKLRKTYKNHIKDHQLSGNFDSIKKEMDASDTLYALMTTPDEEWDAMYPNGKDVLNGICNPVKQLIGKAFTMNRGTIPKSSWSNSILGELVPPSISPEQSRPMASKLNQQQHSTYTKAKKLEGPRPKRSIKKRTYGDTSYEGYGEGYFDDEGHEVDFDISGENLSRKRPKKSAPSHGFQGASARHNSYGPGMVGA